MWLNFQKIGISTGYALIKIECLNRMQVKRNPMHFVPIQYAAPGLPVREINTSFMKFEDFH